MVNDFRSPQAARCVEVLLRFFGGIDLLALVVLFAPPDWIAWVHEATGLGTWPDGRIARYLTRSTSTLYALHGALLLCLSTDVIRYRPIIVWLGRFAVIHGVLLVGIDLLEEMPAWWCCLEGPTFAVAGVALLACTRAPKSPESSQQRKR